MRQEKEEVPVDGGILVLNEEDYLELVKECQGD